MNCNIYPIQYSHCSEMVTELDRLIQQALGHSGFRVYLDSNLNRIIFVVWLSEQKTSESSEKNYAKFGIKTHAPTGL